MHGNKKPEYEYARDRYGELILDEHGNKQLIQVGDCYAKPYQVRPTENKAENNIDKRGKRNE